MVIWIGLIQVKLDNPLYENNFLGVFLSRSKNKTEQSSNTNKIAKSTEESKRKLVKLNYFNNS
jgi:hypothetical protein